MATFVLPGAAHAEEAPTVMSVHLKPPLGSLHPYGVGVVGGRIAFHRGDWLSGSVMVDRILHGIGSPVYSNAVSLNAGVAPRIGHKSSDDARGSLRMPLQLGYQPYSGRSPEIFEHRTYEVTAHFLLAHAGLEWTWWRSTMGITVSLMATAYLPLMVDDNGFSQDVDGYDLDGPTVGYHADIGLSF